MKFCPITIALIVLSNGFSFAQQSGSCLTQTILVNVVDQDGKPVPGLTTDKFRLDGHSYGAKVSSSKFDETPPRIILLIEDGSYRSISERPFVKYIAEDLISNATAQTDFALFTYYLTPKFRLGFGHPRDAVLEAINDLGNSSDKPEPWPKGVLPEAKTRLEQSIKQAAELFGDQRPGDAIYLITGGSFNYLYNHAPSSAVGSSLRSKGVRLFVVLLDPSDANLSDAVIAPYTAPLQTVSAPDQLSLIENFAANTGGRVMILPPQKFHGGLDPLSRTYLQNFHGAIFKRYSIGISLANVLSKPEKLNIFTVNENGKRDKKLMVLHPERLFPCENTPAASPASATSAN